MSDENAKLTGLDAATREQWAREAFHGIELRTKRFGEFVGAVRELVAALPKCGTPGCGQPATRCAKSHCVDCGPDEYYCDEHGDMQSAWQSVPGLDYAPALRKLQAILDPEETEKP